MNSRPTRMLEPPNDWDGPLPFDRWPFSRSPRLWERATWWAPCTVLALIDLAVMFFQPLALYGWTILGIFLIIPVFNVVDVMLGASRMHRILQSPLWQDLRVTRYTNEELLLGVILPMERVRTNSTTFLIVLNLGMFAYIAWPRPVLEPGLFFGALFAMLPRLIFLSYTRRGPLDRMEGAREALVARGHLPMFAAGKRAALTAMGFILKVALFVAGAVLLSFCIWWLAYPVMLIAFFVLAKQRRNEAIRDRQALWVEMERILRKEDDGPAAEITFHELHIPPPPVQQATRARPPVEPFPLPPQE